MRKRDSVLQLYTNCLLTNLFFLQLLHCKGNKPLKSLRTEDTPGRCIISDCERSGAEADVVVAVRPRVVQVAVEHTSISIVAVVAATVRRIIYGLSPHTILFLLVHRL